MKKKLLSALTGVVIVTATARCAWCADLMIEIDGNILANTCTIAPSSKDMLVPLGSHSIKDLKDTLQPFTEFSINLEQCGNSVNGVNMYFTGPTQQGFNLLQSPEMIIQNAAVEVMTAAGDNLMLNSGTGIYSSLTPGANNTIKFKARMRPFMHSKQLMPGPVSVTMTYTLEYL
ncbi:type 1 fimbrial protein [Citrobacter sp. wls710]|uniref:fimbrial protein n=1 Tax=Citrobacter sp. wls710 TaxID=2576426 RepID=UPI0010C9F9C5|nr:fimbrial protein [Citrobacter sp. wls710]TKU73346.1 type 1 fimbrial protein [Citrobacter sp. wls710]